jgi:TetR/AcrR family transcriptional repressor of mexJK operon
MIDVQQTRPALPKRGRPRRGTEIARTTALINAATRVFLREGYGLASIDKVAAEAGVSTRTIYERYKNKADLLGAAIGRLVDRMSTVLSTLDLNSLEPKAALRVIAEIMIDRARDPDAVALFRIVATEAHRFPELAAKMRDNNKLCVDNVVVNYLRGQAGSGVLNLADPDRAATLFRQMICSELHDRLLFGGEAEVSTLDFKSHVDHVIDLFLLGAAPRE